MQPVAASRTPTSTNGGDGGDGAASSPVYTIRGVPIAFPFHAYPCQKLYMQAVLEALQERHNALLESPTGTGKTLCLLCATLAWCEQYVESKTSKRSFNGVAASVRPPLVIYASRTHTQLQQVVKQLHLTRYRPRTAILASRDQLCVHSDSDNVRGAALIQHCQNLNQARQCSYNNNTESFLRRHPEFGSGDVYDIEDLLQAGRQARMCPYYYSIEQAQTSAELILLPYNYLIDPALRDSLKLGPRLDGAIVIFDEAHNLESSCEESASFDLTAELITCCIRETDRCVAAVDSPGFQAPSTKSPSDMKEELLILKLIFLKLEAAIADLHVGDQGLTDTADAFFELLGHAGITRQTYQVLAETLSSFGQVLGHEAHSSALWKLRNALDIAFRLAPSSLSSYRMHVHKHGSSSSKKFLGGNNNSSSGTAVSHTVSFWCFSSGEAMETLSNLGVASMILTSGTLSPMESLAMQLRRPFPVRLENEHVVDASQVFAAVVSKGPSNVCLNSSYRNRSSPAYNQDLGNALVNFARVVPDGLLVFFASYAALSSACEAWALPGRSSSGASPMLSVLQRLAQYKPVFREPRTSAAEFNAVVQSYRDAVASGSGAILMAVCRGKVSEGVDFADRVARAVVITGLPFASSTAARVRLKKLYLDKEHGVGAGQKWYQQEAYRAVNQALGRVLRHRHDHGAILLCDGRFASPSSQAQLSHWLARYVNVYASFGSVSQHLPQFFRRQQPLPLAAASSASSAPPSSAKFAHLASGSGHSRSIAAAAAAAAASPSPAPVWVTGDGEEVVLPRQEPFVSGLGGGGGGVSALATQPPKNTSSLGSVLQRRSRERRAPVQLRLEAAPSQGPADASPRLSFKDRLDRQKRQKQQVETAEPPQRLLEQRQKLAKAKEARKEASAAGSVPVKAASAATALVEKLRRELSAEAYGRVKPVLKRLFVHVQARRGRGAAPREGLHLASVHRLVGQLRRLLAPVPGAAQTVADLLQSRHLKPVLGEADAAAAFKHEIKSGYSPHHYQEFKRLVSALRQCNGDSHESLPVHLAALGEFLYSLSPQLMPRFGVFLKEFECEVYDRETAHLRSRFAAVHESDLDTEIGRPLKICRSSMASGP